MTASVRPVRWPDDQSALARIDRSFETDRVFRVTRDGLSFVVREEEASPPYRRTEPPIDVDELKSFAAVFVAERDGEVIGYGALQREDWNRRANVTAFYVDRASRGAGVGRALLEALATAAREAGMNRLWIETQDVNLPAFRFYLACGFMFCGLDTSLYDPDTRAGGETALYLTRPIDASVR